MSERSDIEVAPFTKLRPDSATDGYCSKGARISACGRYRYLLWREWRSGSDVKWNMWTDDNGSPVVDGAGHQLGDPKILLFVMLNPSTADAEEDDPTIRRCVNYAKAWGYDRVEVVNLFAYRATRPSELLALDHNADPVGHENERVIRDRAWDADKIICAWGAHGSHIGQDQTVLGWLEAGRDEAPIEVLSLTKGGHPGHPLYLRGDLKPFPHPGVTQ